MKILVILKNPVYFDDGLLVCENAQGYIIDREKGFLEINYKSENSICVNLNEIVYFKIYRKDNEK